MFYSHEILTSTQYGVATIWLVATVGNGCNRKLNRKVLQDVNIPKACQKIIDPGAPLALRLQGNLLYGVSRVFSHQCHYVLADAGKTQSDMMTFFHSMNTSEIDPKAGKAKRHQITLQDDPNFDPTNSLPTLEALLNSEMVSFNYRSTQESASKYSQLSPLDRSQLKSASTSRNSSFIGIDLPPSSHSIGSYHLPGDLVQYSSPVNKGPRGSDLMADFQPHPEEEIDSICGVGLDFDANGNLVGILDGEPELPPLHGTSPDPLHAAEVVLPGIEEIKRQSVPFMEGENVFEFEEAVLPDAEPFPVHPTGNQVNTDALTLTTETTETGKATASNGPSRQRRPRAMLDHEPQLLRRTIIDWNEKYAESMTAARKRLKVTTQARAKANALLLVYNNGLSHVGAFERTLGIPHPLAKDFAGTSLKAHLLGLSLDDIESINANTKTRRGRRRKSPEAFGDDDNTGNRNVRRRFDEIGELGRGQAAEHGDGHDLGDDTAPEVGMEAAPALEDKHSSSLMPWSRQGSAVPGSATRAPSSAQKPLPAPSPLHGRGSILGSIERHSDPAEDPFGVVGFGSQLSSLDIGADQGALSFGIVDDTQVSTAGLDISSQDFLGYLSEKAFQYGVTQSSFQNDQKKCWVDFEELINPNIHTKEAAAKAFLHILSLATKSVISVEQDGIEDQEPFGALRIGLGTNIFNMNCTTVE